MFKDALKTRDFSEDALILVKAATLLKKDILSHQGFKFTGCFPAQCQEDSIPSSLKSLVSMILNGSNLKDQQKRGLPGLPNHRSEHHLQHKRKDISYYCEGQAHSGA